MDEEAKAERLWISDQLGVVVRLLGAALAHDDGSLEVQNKTIKLMCSINDLAERLHEIENPGCPAATKVH